jgi:hypothetical protein
MFTVYTYFGRVISTHTIQGLHHEACEEARLAVVEYEMNTGNPAWVKLTY